MALLQFNLQIHFLSQKDQYNLNKTCQTLDIFFQSQQRLDDVATFPILK